MMIFNFNSISIFIEIIIGIFKRVFVIKLAKTNIKRNMYVSSCINKEKIASYIVFQKLGIFNRESLKNRLIINKVENSQFVVTAIKNYKDVKAYHKSSIKGHLTLIPYLYTEKEIFNKYINNYVSLLKNFKTNPFCIDLLEEILDIKNDQSLTISDKVLSVNKLLFKASEKVEFQEKGLNFSIVGDSGETDVEFQYLQSEIDKKICKISMDSINFPKIFPNSCVVSVLNTKLLYLQIAKYLPENIKTQTIQNLLNFYDNI